jgi:hypothetical protein
MIPGGLYTGHQSEEKTKLEISGENVPKEN